MRVVVAQLGARMHYAVPRILHRVDALEMFHTDLCAKKGVAVIARLFPANRRPLALQRVASRVPEGVPPRRIRVYSSLGILYAYRLRKAVGRSERIRTYLWAGETFCKRVRSHGFGEADTVFGFNTAALEILAGARDQGLRTVVEQTIAPSMIEDRLLEAERERFPEWAEKDDSVSLVGLRERLAIREAYEWDLADVILCGSDFVRTGVEASGGPVGRCVVVPYGVELPTALDRVGPHRPLRVLVVGAVGLRKGSPYVLAAARRLGPSVVVRMVGPVTVEGEALGTIPSNVIIEGPVPRSSMGGYFQWADVFLLPSICEGSATATYEALGWGLPVICTPNTGSVVRDGVDGFIVPVCDPDSIAERLNHLRVEEGLWSWMSGNARRRAGEFTLDRYAQRLVEALATPGEACGE